MDLMEAAMSMFKHLPQNEALMKIVEIPEFRQLAQGSPFERNDITQITGKENGSIIASFDWKKVHEQDQKLTEEHKTEESSLDDDWNELVNGSQQKLSSRGRKLEAKTDVPAAIEASINLVKEVMEQSIKVNEDIQNQNKSYLQLTSGKATSDSLKILEKSFKNYEKARSNLKTAFQILKAAVFELYSDLQGQEKYYQMIQEKQQDNELAK